MGILVTDDGYCSVTQHWILEYEFGPTSSEVGFAFLGDR